MITMAVPPANRSDIAAGNVHSTAQVNVTSFVSNLGRHPHLDKEAVGQEDSKELNALDDFKRYLHMGTMSPKPEVTTQRIPLTRRSDFTDFSDIPESIVDAPASQGSYDTDIAEYEGQEPGLAVVFLGGDQQWQEFRREAAAFRLLQYFYASLMGSLISPGSPGDSGQLLERGDKDWLSLDAVSLTPKTSHQTTRPGRYHPRQLLDKPDLPKSEQNNYPETKVEPLHTDEGYNHATLSRKIPKKTTEEKLHGILELLRLGSMESSTTPSP